MKFSFGSDGEFMLSRAGKYYSAIGVFPPQKHCIQELGNKFYYDNVLVEIGLKPANNKEELVENIRNCLNSLVKLANPFDVVIQAAQDYPATALTHDLARKAGCMEEWCCYRLIPIDPPKEVITNTPFRTAGGHIHLGSKTGPLQDGMALPFIIKMLDLFLGLPSIFIDKDKTSKNRRKIYGAAGTHRKPIYGIEYRTIGNFWYNSPKLACLMFDICDFVLDFVENEGHLRFWTINEDLLDSENPAEAYSCYGYDIDLLRKCINTCDMKAGKKFLNFIENFMPERLIHDLHEAYNLETLDFKKEWQLETT